MIKFQCPNGHPLTTTDDRAGTAAKCPKCQVPLVVPMASTTNGAAGGSTAKAATESGVAASQSGTQTSASSNPPGDLIVFLCPNGHKLNGPARLKGKAGQCPHCGAKFRIPEDDDAEDIEDVEEFEEEQMAESMTEEEFAAEEVEDEDIEEIHEFEEEEFEAPEDEDIDELEPFEEAPPTVIDAFLSPAPEDVHPYAAMVSALWAAKEPGQTIDLYLQKGEIFSPELFAESLSQPLFGVFGRREKEGGGHALIMLPWDNITRIEVRNVKQVPVGILK